MHRLLTTCLLVLLITACGQQDIDEGEHVWKDQVEAMDKAKAVEETLENAAQKRREAEQEAMH